jgi:hypothetical protein
MGSSSIYMIDHNFNGIEDFEYNNSWLFAPIIWNVLLNKYMRHDIQTPYGYRKGLIGFGGNKSVDDGVESWFSKYDDETDEYKEKSLNECSTVIAEFVKINDGEITFINNFNYFKSIV